MHMLILHVTFSTLNTVQSLLLPTWLPTPETSKTSITSINKFPHANKINNMRFQPKKGKKSKNTFSVLHFVIRWPSMNGQVFWSFGLLLFCLTWQG